MAASEPRQPVISEQAPVVEALLAEWEAAYAAFQGSFDTPLARRKDDSEYAQDARRRLRDFGESLAALRSSARKSADEGQKEQADALQARPYAPGRVVILYDANPVGELWLLGHDGMPLGGTGPIQWPSAWRAEWTRALHEWKFGAAMSSQKKEGSNG